ncbi:hypothetical protein DRQ07_00220 [candidate division KSB1 bacterium]|nr:MAG: hypothetical protein DRQ07_00220 [candidate division KSB1 bacterium]
MFSHKARNGRKKRRGKKYGQTWMSALFLLHPSAPLRVRISNKVNRVKDHMWYKGIRYFSGICFLICVNHVRPLKDSWIKNYNDQNRDESRFSLRKNIMIRIGMSPDFL